MMANEINTDRDVLIVLLKLRNIRRILRILGEIYIEVREWIHATQETDFICKAK